MRTKRVEASREERRFLAAGAAALALTLVLAFWFAVPLGPAQQADAYDLQPLIQSARVNLNTADMEALCTLPGVGEVIAQRILDYRVQYGPFRYLSDLTRVSGITENTIEKWQGLGYVS